MKMGVQHEEVRIIFILYPVCMPCSDSSLKDVTYFLTTSTLVAWGSYLGETQMWRCLKCYTRDCISGVFEWLLVLGESMYHCGLSATEICKLRFSFVCIYLKIYISLECLPEVTELVAGLEARISDHMKKMKFTFFTYSIGWRWNCQVSIHQRGMVGITVIVIWKNHCLPSSSYCRWSGWDQLQI